MGKNRFKMSYKNYEVTYDNETGDLFMYKDRNNQIISVVDAVIKDEKELIELVEMVLKTVDRLNEDKLNSLAERMQASETIESILSPSKFN